MILISVDLPAPFTPSTAMRLDRRVATLTSFSCGLVAPGVGQREGGQQQGQLVQQGASGGTVLPVRVT
jgi:hypothetical protein